jgi:transposase
MGVNNQRSQVIPSMEVDMGNDSTVYVGLDIHKESIIGAYAVELGEIQDLGEVGVLQRDLDRLCTRMQSKAANVHFVYEAGPCGYGVYRYLTSKGHRCTVCAPSKLARKPGDRVKTDRRDAQKLVRGLRMNDLSAVHVPDITDEAFRDLVRAWCGARSDLRQAKQRLKSFLLVHDVRYTGKANWGEAHRRWLSKFVFPHENSHLAFQEHLRSIEERLAQCERLEKNLREAAKAWRFYPVIQALQTLRGVQFIVAVGLVAEIGEFSRFATPPQLMAWLGLVPSEDSSGPRQRRGAITKCGNSYARRLLIEAAWAYRYTPKVSPTIQKRHEGMPKPIVDRAWEAQVRLCKRFRKLSARGKPHNVIVVAIARELTGFIWDIARMTTSTPASTH